MNANPPKLRLLIVEDDRIDQMAFERMVKTELLNYECVFATSASQATEILAEQSFHLIILDYLLEDGTAFDLFYLIGETPIIVVTGEGNEGIAYRAMKDGAYDYLIKDRERNYLNLLPITIKNAIHRRAIEQQMVMLTSAMKNISDSVYITDMEEKFLFVNTSFCKNYRYHEEQILGKHSSIIWQNQEDFQQSHEMDQVWEGEVVHQDRSGNPFSVLLTRSSVLLPNRSIIVGVAKDITEIKKAQEALKQSEEALRLRNDIIEKDLKLAQIIHKTMLYDDIPQINHLKIAYRYRTMDKVGGDYFSFNPLSDSELGIFIGDVSGHGVSAALFLGLLKVVTKRIIEEFGTNPVHFIESLNRELLGNMPFGFLTAIYGYFNYDKHKNNGVLKFAKGGHPAPVLHHGANDTLSYLHSKGTLLGMYDEVSFEEVEITLYPGDRVYFYTDGISEITNAQEEMISFAQFLDLIKQASTPNLEQTLDNILFGISRYSNDKPIEDDMILISFEITS